MQISLGFTQNSAAGEKPRVNIMLNDQVLMNNLLLDNCGCVDDPTAKIQYVTMDSDIDNSVNQEHILKIQGLNLFEYLKTSNTDFGFQVRCLELNGIDMEYFSKVSAAYNPIIDIGYIKNYLEPNDKLCELELINGRLMHVVRGEYANYVNHQGGWVEFKFKTPLYNWLLDINFGNLAKSMIFNF